MKPVALIASGMMTSVGLTSASSCAAIRCAIDNFTETSFTDEGGEWIIAGQVSLEQPWQGLTKLVKMASAAIRECLDQAGDVRPEGIPLLLGVAETGRPGRVEGIDNEFLPLLQEELQVRFHPLSRVYPQGRVAGALALKDARELISSGDVPLCIIAGADSFLNAATLAAYEEQNRLLTSQNSNGFIPAEAGTAVLVGEPGKGASPQSPPCLLCHGIGEGTEVASILSEEPLRADGLVEAIRNAIADGGIDFTSLDYRITDANGEQYGFKEASLGLTRILRTRKEFFDIWHPADCIGESGAATGPCLFGVALTALRKNYSMGDGVLIHFSSDDGHRVALTFSTSTRRAG